ncbi:bacillithiol biosynthesis deacetylase BshB2 [Scopulibacillus daqui]|uniref:Bacillithiol biosynthesis deacetylase BshB2 n=1 Tax=Scopulibacillus daqui TaxID=1469162 RepID=A0ABS2Q1G9_9BACL|nr:bacillithiol biosynthesis deacetylase BshB2 [Scopulibacillus daqui]MBM7645966.1 bacillithiol biosynthesis deacetylase BshB2 [Scopulibacillus daqui]
MDRHVLIVFPHPDDEAFGVSGSIMKYIQEGISVTYVCLTLGEMGRNMGKPPFATRESLPEIRKKELEEACRITGIKDLRRMGLRDKTVEFEDPEELAKRIRAVIDEITPEVIITFYPGYSVHPDHNACGAAVIKAVESMAKDQRPEVHCLAFSHDCYEKLGQPDIKRDVSEFADRKLEVIKAHRSQTQGLVQGIKKRLSKENQEFMNQLKTERFWIYKFQN